MSTILHKYLKEREPLIEISDNVPTPFVVTRRVVQVGSAATAVGVNFKKELEYQTAKAIIDLKRGGILMLDKISLRPIVKYVMSKPNITCLDDNKVMIEISMGMKYV